MVQTLNRTNQCLETVWVGDVVTGSRDVNEVDGEFHGPRSEAWLAELS